jgi:hypothetical protein
MCKIKTKTHVAIIAFVLTFTFGVGVAFFYVSQKYSLRPFTQPTSLCVAKKNRNLRPKSEGDKYVYLTGNLYGKKLFHFSDVKVNDCEDSYAEIVLADEQILSVESRKLMSEISRLTDGDNTARIKVEIVGTLEERVLLGYAQSRYVLTAIQIMPIGSLEVLDRPALSKEYQESR